MDLGQILMQMSTNDASAVSTPASAGEQSGSAFAGMLQGMAPLISGKAPVIAEQATAGITATPDSTGEDTLSKPAGVNTDVMAALLATVVTRGQMQVADAAEVITEKLKTEKTVVPSQPDALMWRDVTLLTAGGQIVPPESGQGRKPETERKAGQQDDDISLPLDLSQKVTTATLTVLTHDRKAADAVLSETVLPEVETTEGGAEAPVKGFSVDSVPVVAKQGALSERIMAETPVVESPIEAHLPQMATLKAAQFSAANQAPSEKKMSVTDLPEVATREGVAEAPVKGFSVDSVPVVAKQGAPSERIMAETPVVESPIEAHLPQMATIKAAQFSAANQAPSEKKMSVTDLPEVATREGGAEAPVKGFSVDSVPVVAKQGALSERIMAETPVVESPIEAHLPQMATIKAAQFSAANQAPSEKKMSVTDLPEVATREGGAEAPVKGFSVDSVPVVAKQGALSERIMAETPVVESPVEVHSPQMATLKAAQFSAANQAPSEKKMSVTDLPEVATREGVAEAPVKGFSVDSVPVVAKQGAPSERIMAETPVVESPIEAHLPQMATIKAAQFSAANQAPSEKKMSVTDLPEVATREGGAEAPVKGFSVDSVPVVAKHGAPERSGEETPIAERPVELESPQLRTADETLDLVDNEGSSVSSVRPTATVEAALLTVLENHEVQRPVEARLSQLAAAAYGWPANKATSVRLVTSPVTEIPGVVAAEGATDVPGKSIDVDSSQVGAKVGMPVRSATEASAVKYPAELNAPQLVTATAAQGLKANEVATVQADRSQPVTPAGVGSIALPVAEDTAELLDESAEVHVTRTAAAAIKTPAALVSAGNEKLFQEEDQHIQSDAATIKKNMDGLSTEVDKISSSTTVEQELLNEGGKEDSGHGAKEQFHSPTTHQHVKSDLVKTTGAVSGTGQADTSRSDMAENIFRQVKEALVNREVKTGKEMITMRLTPEHLGELTLNFKMENQQLKIEVVAANRVVRDALMQHSENLKESLARQNINMESFDVVTSGGQRNFEQNDKGWKQMAQQQFMAGATAGGYRYRAPEAEVPNLPQYGIQKQYAMLDVHY